MMSPKRWSMGRALAILAGLTVAAFSATTNAAVILEASGASATGPTAGAIAELQFLVYSNTANWETTLGVSGNVSQLDGTTTGTEQFVYFYEISKVNAGSTINLLLINTPSAGSAGFLTGTVFSAPNAVSAPTGLTSGTGIGPDGGIISPTDVAFNWNSGLTPSSPNSLVLFITSNQSNVTAGDSTLRFFPFVLDSGFTQAPSGSLTTPLPATLGLLLSAIPGFVGIVFVARRKKLLVAESVNHGIVKEWRFTSGRPPFFLRLQLNSGGACIFVKTHEKEDCQLSEARSAAAGCVVGCRIGLWHTYDSAQT